MISIHLLSVFPDGKILQVPRSRMMVESKQWIIAWLSAMHRNLIPATTHVWLKTWQDGKLGKCGWSYQVRKWNLFCIDCLVQDCGNFRPSVMLIVWNWQSCTAMEIPQFSTDPWILNVIFYELVYITVEDCIICVCWSANVFHVLWCRLFISCCQSSAKIQSVFGTHSKTLNTLRQRQNGHQFADDIFKCIFMNENVRI